MEWARRQPVMTCPLCRTIVENTMQFTTLALQEARANVMDMARIIRILEFPQTVDDGSDDDDDGIYLPRYEPDLLSSDDSQSESINSFNDNSDESDMD
jgi:hypothetical protein